MLVLTSALSMTFSLAACSSPTQTTETPAPSAKVEEKAQPADQGNEEIKAEAGAKLIIWEAKEEQEFLETMAKEFEAKYKVKVEFQEAQPGDQMTKLKTDGPAGLGADIIVTPHDHLGELIASGLILPNDFYAEDTKKNFAKAAVDAASMNGTLYGYPRNMETYLLYYNKSLVKKEDLGSWDSIIKFAKSYNDPANNKFGFMYEANNFYFNYAWIAGNGGYVFGKNGTDPKDIGLNTKEAADGMKFFHSLREAFPIKAVDATGDVKTAAFQSGKLPINLDGVWQMANFNKEKLGFEVGAVPLPPMPNGKKPVTFAGVKTYFVSSFSKYPNAAKLFIHYATSQESMVKNYKMAGIIPARNGMENDPTIKQDERALAFLEQFKSTQPMPAILEMRQVWGPATAALEPIWNGEDIQKLLDKAVFDIKTGIEQQGKK